MNSQSTAQKPIHSSLLIWMVLIMVMLSGLLYLGVKIKQQRIVEPSSTSKKPTQPLPSTNPISFEKALATLQAQQLIYPVVYKISVVMAGETTTDATQNPAALWEHGQQQLTFVKATVRAGVDLSELTMKNLNLKPSATLNLPPARIILNQIDNITTYDIKTGLPSTVQLGLSLTSAQERAIKAQIEHQFCQSDLLQTTTENTRQHVMAILATMNITMNVQAAESAGCLPAAS
jgi:hypothetical protein